MMVNTIIAIPKLPRKYLDIRTKKFTIGFSRIVFKSPVMETTPVMRRKRSTPISRKMRNLRTLKAFAGFASAIVSSISLAQWYAPYLATDFAVQGIKFVVLTIYVNCASHSIESRKDFRFEIDTIWPFL
jgi:hypothetical protein